MFGKLIKKLKKRSVYWRIGIVYIIFLIVKWFMYEMVGIEIGKEGFGSASSLVARINGGATELAKLCTNQQVKNSSSSAGDQNSKLKLSKCKAEKLRLKSELNALRSQKQSSNAACPDCSKFACVQKKVGG